MGNTQTHTHRWTGDLISLLSFLESGLKVARIKQTAAETYGMIKQK
jgi:hypothetical protein